MVNTMKAWQQVIRAWAVSKEWRGEKADPRTFGDDIALIHSEGSEALEAYRECKDPNRVWYTYTVEIDHVKFKNLTAEQVEVLTGSTPGELDLEGKPEGVGPELADIIIRILDVAEHYGLNMDNEVRRKMEHNATREIRHGGKYL